MPDGVSRRGAVWALAPCEGLPSAAIVADAKMQKPEINKTKRFSNMGNGTQQER